LLFAIGFFGVLLRRNTLVVYLCLELMLSASTLAAVAFSRFNGTMDGKHLRVFSSSPWRPPRWRSASPIIVALFRLRHTVQLEELTALKH